jgi:hypothetical protein
MFCLFVRFLPMVATSEVKTVLPQADPHGHAGAEREIRHHHGRRLSPEPAPGSAS